MTARKRKRAPGGGRKPAGERGAMASKYPQVRIAPDALESLKPIAAERGIPLWEIVTEAARLLIKQQHRKG